MKIYVLADNKESEDFGSEHGLSLYIEYGDRKLLLDAGRSELFYINAVKLGIDIAKVDTAILSHSHYDHADGFYKFFEINEEAKLYLRKECGEKYYSMHEDGLAYIGPKKGMLSDNKERIVYIENEKYELSHDIMLIAHSSEKLDEIGEHAKLYIEEKGSMKPDDFAHEQSLVFRTEQGLVIFNSCSHGGPDNIIREVKMHFPNEEIYAYVGGFHLFKSSDEEVRDFVEQLEEIDVKHIITGHCTGERAYEIMKLKLGEKVQQMHAGMFIEMM